MARVTKALQESLSTRKYCLGLKGIMVQEADYIRLQSSQT